MLDESGHAALVDAWLSRVPAALPAAERLELLERALEALWRRAHETLGEITLAAIADRTVCYAVERFPPLAVVTVDTTGFNCAGLRERASVLQPDDVAAWTRFMLAEFLTVLGNLTAEVLTPALHAALSALAPPAAAAAGKATDGDPGPSAVTAKETRS